MRWNASEKVYAADKCIHHLFEEQVVRTPEAVALEFGRQRLTYTQLNERANRIGRAILNACQMKESIELAPETLVAIVMERSADVMPSLLAVLKARGAYVPIDPAYPEERIRSILSDTRAKFILTQSRLADKLKQLGADADSIICVDEMPVNPFEPAGNLDIQSHPNDLAYVLYTSGSTGKPKGALIEHAGLVSLRPYVIEKFGISPGARVLQFASASFDASVYEWIGTLTVGGTLVVLSGEELPPYADISDILEDKNIHITMLTPSVISTMKKRELPQVRTIVSGGEDCTPDIVDYWAQNRLFLNAYGPTEVTVMCSAGECRPGQKITIGKPVDNKQLFVLNRFGNPVPVGVPGELWVGGIGLARGYLNREQQTRERFVVQELNIKAGGKPHPIRLYKTGDTVKWNDSGELEFIGRSDDQVKIRGFRIEPGEIEHQLRQCSGIDQCVVSAWQDGDYQKLIAYYTGEQELEQRRLSEQLLSILPVYMIPSHFVYMNMFPLNNSGKIDRAALPLPSSTPRHMSENAQAEFEPAKRLLRIWRSLLKRNDIGLNDHFNTVGGDSILSIHMVSLAREEGIILTPRLVADNPTIQGLSEAVLALEKEHKDALTNEPTGDFGLSPIQHWFFEQKFEEPHYFNQSQLFLLSYCSLPKLESALNRLIQLHPELTTEFIVSQRPYKQRYCTEISPIQIDEYTICGQTGADEEISAICEEWHRQLNYESGRMMHAGLIKGYPDGKERLFITIHHLVVDGVSWRILLQDLDDLYHDIEPMTVPSSYIKWQAILEEYAQKEETMGHLKYWLDVQDRYSPLPLDCTPVPIGSQEYSELTAALSPENTQLLLQRCSHAYHTQINDLLLSAWALTLNGWMKQETVIFRLEGHGREHLVSDMDLSRTIGWFTSMFPVCIEVPGNISIGEIIISIKEQLRNVPHRGISYGALRYCHSDQSVRDALNKPEPQAVFNYLGQFSHRDTPNGEEGWIKFTREVAQDNISKFNHGTSLLELNCSVVDGQLQLFMKYEQNYYGQAEMQKLLNHYVSHLIDIIEHCSRQEKERYTPSDFPMVSLTSHSIDKIVDTYHSKFGLEQILPLTPLQEGLLFHYLEHPASDQYFVQVSWKYRGQLNLRRYREAWSRVIEENDCLRIGYAWDELDNPVQCVMHRTVPYWAELNLEDLSPDRQQEQINEWLTNDRSRQFDLLLPPYRFATFRLSSAEHIIIWSYHHILLDGWTLPLLLNRVHDIYCSTDPAELQPSRTLSLNSYLKWMLSKDKREGEAFWKAYMAGLTESTPVPMDMKSAHSNVHVPIRVQESYTQFIPSSIVRQLADFVQQNQITLNTLLQFAWGKVLQIYHNSDVTVFGMVVSGRGSDLANGDRITGPLINTLPIIMRWNTDQSITEYLRQLHRTLQSINDYCHVSLNDLKSWSSLQESTIFHSIVAFENYLNDYRQPSAELTMSDMAEYEKTNYPLTIAISDTEEKIAIKFIYDAERLNAESVERMAEHTFNIIQFILEHPECAIGDIRCLSNEEYQTIVYDWNDTFTDYPRSSSINELFDEQVRAQSDHPAVITSDRNISYGELKQLSRNVANLLWEHGAGREKLVGVFLPRSSELVIALLGILEAGCAYVPIDPEFPAERVLETVREAQLDILITSSDLQDTLSNITKGLTLNIIRLDDAPQLEQRKSFDSVSLRSSLAYVMFTSGSTGKPKGVMIEHRSVIRLVKNNSYFPFVRGIRLLYTGSPVFDNSTFELWGTLLNGGTLYIVPGEELLNIDLLERRLKEWKINTISLTSSLCNQWIDLNANSFAGIKWLLVGGDVVSPHHINQIRIAFPKMSIMNQYGPTENTTFSTSYPVQRAFETSIPIGRPISNSTCYVLDQRGSVQPIGAAGELYVGGDGIARGYWAQNELTQSRFIPNPYASIEDRRYDRNTILYRTGDKVRWLKDGNIEFIGRVDHQVKIRGFRIEPGEVASQLSRFPRIKECLVVVREQAGDKQLVAYYRSRHAYREEELYVFMAEHVPSYMIPSRFVHLEWFPLTINGKIDRKRLPLPENRVTPSTISMRPANELEELLGEVWSDVLGYNSIGVNEDFHVLGGHSLHALRIANYMQKKGFAITANQILSRRTIRNLALILNETSTRADAEALQEYTYLAAEHPYPFNGFPLSAVQRRFFKRELVNRNMFNVPYIALLKDRVTREALNQALDVLIYKHEALRLVFAKLNDKEWYQHTQGDNLEQILIWIDVSDESDSSSHDAFITDYCSKLQYGFDIEKGPLWRVVLFDRYGHNEQQILLVLFHHLIFDGLSMNLFLDDLKRLLMLGGRPPADGEEETAGSYRDWCVALEQYAAKGISTVAKKHWSSVLKDARSLQVDKQAERHPVHHDMLTFTHELLTGEEEIRSLRETAVKLQTTPFALMLAALAGACYDLKGQSDLLLHLMSHQRESFSAGPPILNTIGFFAGAYPVRIHSRLDNFKQGREGDLITHVNQILQSIPMNGLDYLVMRHMIQENQKPLHDASHMLFHYLSQETDMLYDDFYQTVSIPYGDTNSKDNFSAYLLNLTATMKRDKLLLTCYFSSLHYKNRTIEKLAHLFSQRLHRSLRPAMHVDLTPQPNLLLDPKGGGANENI
ncbi:amino acid adenylation domain-containing protein [Paenibacillus sp. MER TA 81-3]|nr:amino acid adenylation domain-containing protein [Paenibacillus sp. MER TA 81-3]